MNSNSGRAHMLAYDDHALWQANSYSADFINLSQASNQSLNENPQSGSQSINQDPSKSGNIPSGGAAPSAKSYMLTFRIPEQLTMSTIHFHQFLNLVNDWNFTGVELFAYSASSTLFGLRSLHSNPKDSIPYNKLYNISAQNEYMSECMKRQSDPETGRPTLFVPMADFLRNSYRKLVLVYFAAHGGGQQVLSSGVCQKMDGEIDREKEPFTDCSSAAKTHGMFDRVEQLLSKEEEIERSSPSIDGLPSPLPEHLGRFKVVQAFCIKRAVKISLRDFKTFVFNHIGAHRSSDGTNEFSIIFISWQGRFTHPLVASDVSNYINNCRIPWGRPFYSDYVKNIAREYVDSLGFLGQPYLSIHVRYEKLYAHANRYKKPQNEFLECCMKRLNSVITAVKTKFNISDGNIIFNWDCSPYGSTACPNQASVNGYLKTVTAKPTYFEPKNFGLPAHRGLIALVEMNALYNGKTLVTVGEGSYQLTIVETFIATHQASAEDPTFAKKAKELHYGHLCIPKEDLHELADTLGPAC